MAISTTSTVCGSALGCGRATDSGRWSGRSSGASGELVRERQILLEDAVGAAGEEPPPEVTLEGVDMVPEDGPIQKRRRVDEPDERLDAPSLARPRTRTTPRRRAPLAAAPARADPAPWPAPSPPAPGRGRRLHPSIARACRPGLVATADRRAMASRPRGARHSRVQAGGEPAASQRPHGRAGGTRCRSPTRSKAPSSATSSAAAAIHRMLVTPRRCALRSPNSMNSASWSTAQTSAKSAANANATWPVPHARSSSRPVPRRGTRASQIIEQHRWVGRPEPVVVLGGALEQVLAVPELASHRIIVARATRTYVSWRSVAVTRAVEGRPAGAAAGRARRRWRCGPGPRRRRPRRRRSRPSRWSSSARAAWKRW